MKYLDNAHKQEFGRLVKDWKSNGCEFNDTRFRQHGEISAPPQMHQKIRDDLQLLADCASTEFEIRGAAFYTLAANKFTEVVKIAKPNCYVEKEVRSERISIPIPRAKFADHAQPTTSTMLTARPVAPASEKIHVGQSSIEVVSGDLAQKQVRLAVRSQRSPRASSSF